MWGNLSLKAAFALAPDSMFINAPCVMITPFNNYMLSILNSKLADWYIRQLGVTRNGGYFEYKPMFVEKLPIPKNSLEGLNAYPVQPTKEQEREIDQLVYQLYGLTDEEIAIVEGNKE